MKLGIAINWTALPNAPAASTIQPSSASGPDLARCVACLTRIQCLYGGSLHVRSSTTADDEAAALSALSTFYESPAAPHYGSDASTDIEDLGIGSHLAQLTLAWGKLIEYLAQVRRGSVDGKIWSPGSSYHQLMARIYEFEISCSDNHRLKALNPESLPPAEFSKHESYWGSWFTMQISYHAYQAVLNHPLLLIYPKGGRPTGRKYQPPSFMQHTVDQAILHAAWVSRMISISTSKEFELSNPFVGHLAGSVATIHFLLCFAKDASVAAKALHDFHRCREFVTSMTQRWTHLRYTVS